MSETPTTCSPDTLTLWSFLPQFIQDQDAANGYPFLSWLEGPGALLQTIDDLCRDNAEGDPGWSILLDIDRCPTPYLPWLAQFVGVRFSSSQTTDAQQRAAIQNEQGFQRGTVASIAAVANALLTPPYTVTITERADFDAYALTISAPNAGMTGGSWAGLVAEEATWSALVSAYATWGAVLERSEAFEAAVLAAVPAGLVVSFAFV